MKKKLKRFPAFSFGTINSCKALCRLLTEKYPDISIICITKGPRGAAVCHKRIYEEIETTPVDVADTVGAGDHSQAGFLLYFPFGVQRSKAASIAVFLEHM